MGSVSKVLSVGSCIDLWKITGVLSMGHAGQVYLAEADGQQVILKSFPPQSQGLGQNEIRLHAHLSGHPNIIRLENVIYSKGWTHAVLEYGQGGDLFTAIIDDGLYYGQHDLIRHVFLQLVDTVRYCHQQGIYHRDLKPENVLVFDGGRTVKLADFGLATTEPVSHELGCGSTFYFSPECQSGAYATGPNDLWSLGILLINLAAGRNPWRVAHPEDDTYRAFLHDPDLLYKILPISRELNRILKAVFATDPRQRPSLDALYSRIQHCRYFTRTAHVCRLESPDLHTPDSFSKDLEPHTPYLLV